MRIKNNDSIFAERKFICFVIDHYNPLGIIRSLGEKGLNPIVVLLSEHPILINKCRYVSKLHIVHSLEEGYSLLLEQYGNVKEKPFLFCCDDKTVEFLDLRYNEVSERFICYNAAGKQGGIVWLQNKDNITNLGEEVGLHCPPKEVVDTGVLPKKLRYPIITKVLASTMGAWKNDVYVCENENELKEAYKLIKSPKLCLQEFINKVGEFCLEGFSINDGQDVFIPYVADYFRYSKDSYGYYMNVIPFEDGELKNRISELIKLTKFNGIFEAEFMKGPDGNNYFLEINFRTSTWNYALTVGGCNQPYFWAKSMLLGRIPYEEMSLRKTPFKAMVEPADFMKNAKTIGLMNWIKDWRSTECYYYYNKKDPKPFYNYWYKRISGKLKRIIK